MKILYISSSQILSKSANSLHVMHMSEALSDMGNDVILIAKKGYKVKDPFDYYNVNKVFELVLLKYLNFRFLGNLIYSISVAIKIFKIKKYDLIFTRFPFWSLFYIPCNKPIIYEAHSLPSSRFKRYVEKRLLRNRNISKIVFISNILKDDYLDLWPWLDKSILYVAPDAARPPNSLYMRKNTDLINKSVGYVGSFYKGKSIEILSRLIEKCGEINFHLIGDTSCVPKIFHRALNSKNVIRHGYVRPEELSKYYKYFDIALLPLSNKVYGANQKQDISRWTSPLKLFEYMANRKCIIASNMPVIREVLENDRNSLLVDVDDIGGWVEAINKAINDSALRNMLIENASEEFCNQFTWGARAKNIMISVSNNRKKKT